MAKRQRADSAASSSAADEPEPCEGTSKYVQFDKSLQCKPVIRCALAPHSRSIPFYSLEDYNVHYAQVHSNRCRECYKNLPSNHFLALHISENHDPINEARRARGEKTVCQTARVLVFSLPDDLQYSCFVEGCDKVCSDPRKRRMHLVDKHLFPKNYDFFLVNDGVDPRRNSSMLRRGYQHTVQTVSSSGSSTHDSTTIKATGQSLQGRQDVHSENAESKASDSGDQRGDSHDSDDPEDESLDHESADEDENGNTESNRPPDSTSTRSVHTPRQNAEDGPESVELASLASSMSALKFVPPSVRFGRGTRSGFAKR